MTRRRAVQSALGAAIIVLVVFGVGAVVNAATARTASRDAMAKAQEAVDAATEGDWSTLHTTLTEAATDIDRADRALNSFFVDPWTVLPFVGTEIRAARHGTKAAQHLITAGTTFSSFLATGPDFYDKGRLNPQPLRQLAGTLEALEPEIMAARQQVNAAGEPRLDQTRQALEQLDGALSDTATALPGIRSLTDDLTAAANGGDPYRILVLFENGAELRATGGLMGFTALITISDDGIGLERVEVVHALRIRHPNGDYISVEAPADYLARYGGFLANTSLWLNINLSPHFPSVAQVAERLYTEATEADPDMVARIDLTGVGYVLEAFPPATIDGEPLDPATLSTDFIIDSYLRFPDQENQTAYLARVVGEVLHQALGAERLDTRTLITSLRQAIAERRVATWTGQPAEQQAFATLGADGAVQPGDPGDLDMIVQNFAANKIDIFTDTEIDVTAQATGCLITTEASVTLTNLAPPEAIHLPVAYYGIDGRWWVNFLLPRDATVVSITVDGEPAKGSIDTEVGRPVASVLVKAPPEATTTVTVTFQELALETQHRIRISPQAMVRPAKLRLLGAEETELETVVEGFVQSDCQVKR